MGNRLTKIYTRTGDDGTTGMADGSRVSKDDLLVHAIGEVDELNSQLAVLASHAPDHFLAAIKTIQNELFNVGAELAMNISMIKQENVDWLEQALDTMNADLPALKEFILPGGGLAASHCHVARSLCRRVERVLVRLNNDMGNGLSNDPDRQGDLNDCLKSYINRLSDYLFVLARAISKAEGENEVYWQSVRLEQ